MCTFLKFSTSNDIELLIECGTNEHWESCGTTCPLTCENYDNPPWFCVLRCDIGCFCNEGYVRSSDGRCIKPEECRARSQGKFIEFYNMF